MISLFSHCSYRLPWCSFASNVIFSSNQIVITLEFVHWESKRAFLLKHATWSARSVGSCKFSSKFIRLTSVANNTDKYMDIYAIVKHLRTLRRKWLLETKRHMLKPTETMADSVSKIHFSFPSNQQVIFRAERLYTLINHLTTSISAWQVFRPSVMYHGHQWAISSAITIVMKATKM